MKELTIEEKAKRYDEAIERAKIKRDEYIRLDGPKSHVPQDIENIFPELKESEDEKIRNEIIDYLERFIPHHEYDLVAKSRIWIAWLKKQAEQPNKVSIWKHWKDGIAGNNDSVPTYLIKRGTTYSLSSCLGFECDYIELSELDKLMVEKQGEQKMKTEPKDVIDVPLIDIPFGAKDSELIGATYFIPKGFHAEIEDDKVIFKKGERKSAWSEEDEERFVSCLQRLGTGNLKQPETINTVWLKSLKERVQLV